jgi:hypothetical protein
LKAKIANAALIKQEGRPDEKHVRMMIICVAAFIRELLENFRAGGTWREAGGEFARGDPGNRDFAKCGEGLATLGFRFLGSLADDTHSGDLRSFDSS